MKRPHVTASAGERGFTLVELLVVVLIIAVLAAVALPLFMNQRTKAQDVEARAAATAVVKALLVWHQDNETFAGAGPEELAAIEPTVGDARGLVVTGTADSFTVRVDSAAGIAGGGPFRVAHSPSGTVRSCDGAGRGGCPSDGLW